MSLPAAAPAQDEPENHLGLDLFAFGQWDQDGEGGDPFRAEDFDYRSFAQSALLALSERVSLETRGTLAWLTQGDLPEFPDTVRNAHVTTASTDTLIMDSAVGVRIAGPRSPYRGRIGAFYTHQYTYQSGGGDTSVSRSLLDDNTTLTLDHRWRVERVVLTPRWNGRDNDRGHRGIQNFLLTWTQIWAPAWVTSAGLQYAHHHGMLLNKLNFTVLYDDQGVPIEFQNEVLPTIRNRLQLNGRVRFSPRAGTSLGMDTSVYTDDWGILNVAGEPSLEVGLSPRFSARGWVRVSRQRGTRYFRDMPTTTFELRTRDSDLGTFTMYSPGALVLWRMRDEVDRLWTFHVSSYGFVRSDGVNGAGGLAGAAVAW